MDRNTRRTPVVWGLVVWWLVSVGAVGANGIAPETLSGTPNRQAITAAIDRGVTYLQSAQQDTGEFLIYASQDPREVQASHAAHCPMFTAFILSSLAAVDHPQVSPIRERALRYVLSEMEPGGLWRFYGAGDMWHRQCGPDLDDTAAVGAVLAQHHIPIPDNLEVLLRYRDPHGAFYTWFDPLSLSARIRGYVNELKVPRGMPVDQPNDVDCAVNANVLWYFALRGQTAPTACRYVNERLQAHDVPRCALYYPSPLHVFYMVVRAYTDGARCLGPGVRIIQRWLPQLQQADGSWGDELETACAVSTLLRLHVRGSAVDRAVGTLLARQQAGGSWPRCRLVEANHRAEAVTTAFALEALSRYLNAADTPLSMGG